MLMKKFLFLIGLAFLFSCKKDEQVSVVPEISFTALNRYVDAAGKDTAIELVFKIKDGDGDIGFGENEFDKACGADNNNLYVKYEELRGNAYAPKKLWLQVTDISASCDTTIYFDSVQVAFEQRMQYIEPAGNKKSIEADVYYRINGLNLMLLSANGRFDFYIRDRANHKSNMVITPGFFISK
jgi:hypothetical protein